MGRALLILVRVLLTPLLFLLIGVVFISCVATDAVDRHLLNADFYLDALDENDAYSRILDEFLLEVEQSETTQRIVAHTDTTSAEMAALVREIIGVEWLRDQARANFHTFFRYIRNETDELLLLIDLQPVLDRMQPALSDFLIDMIGEMRTRPVGSYEEFREQLEGLMDQIRDGNEVIYLPTYELSDRERDDLLDEIFARDSLLEGSDARQAVDEALQRQDTAGALIAMVDELLAVRLDESTAELREKLDSENRLDLVAQIADDEGKTRAEVLSEFEDLRQAVGWLTGRGRLGGALLLLLLAVLMGLLYLPHRLWAGLVPGVALIVWGVIGLLSWAIFVSTAPVFAHNRVIENDTDLSDSGVALMADVADALVRGSADSILRPSLAVLFVGIAAILGGVVLHLVVKRRPPRENGDGPEDPGETSEVKPP